VSRQGDNTPNSGTHDNGLAGQNPDAIPEVRDPRSLGRVTLTGFGCQLLQTASTVS
jgi:hypothetical protein